MSDNVKVLFRFYSKVLEKEMVETMWAVVVDESKGLYELDNIPFYVPSISSGDIFFAEYDDMESILTYRSTVEYSGNSTVRIITLNDEIDLNNIVSNFMDMGCIIEKLSDRYLAMEIPRSTNYKSIQLKLKELEDDEILSFEESCLSSIHQY